MITIKRLATPESIEQACALLYEVFIQKQEWQFSTDNPSRITTEIRNGKMVLIDRFVNSSIWFGAFHQEKMVGCVRLSGVDENNKLEVEGYSSSAVITPHLPLVEKDRCFEIQKLVTHKDFIGRGIVKKLVLACFRFCKENQSTAIALTHNAYLKALFKKINFPLILENAFKYEPQDTSEVNFYFADYKKSEVDQTLEKLKCVENDMNNNRVDIFKALQIVEPILPTPFYWMDTDGVVLGINELCLKAIGTTREIIGKKPYDFYSRDIADHILSHNEEVIRREEVLTQEEWIEDITTKERKCFSSIKAPLYDDQGVIVGIIGTSIEVTAEKQAAQLKLETERQRIEIEEKEKFTLLARKFAHDIASPLTSIKIIFSRFNNTLQEESGIFSKAVDNLLKISDQLLATYRRAETESILDVGDEIKQPINLCLYIQDILAEKRIEYQDRHVVFDFQQINNEFNNKFILMIPLQQFKRAFSNLLNNAVDALELHENGKVLVKLEAGKNITLSIIDNGKGMPEEVRQKILAGCRVTNGKETGNGMGMQQVGDLLKQTDASLQIHSIPGAGTVMEITFPRTAS